MTDDLKMTDREAIMGMWALGVRAYRELGEERLTALTAMIGLNAAPKIALRDGVMTLSDTELHNVVVLAIAALSRIRWDLTEQKRAQKN